MRGGQRYHPRRRRAVCLSIIRPEGRKVFGLQDEIPDNTRTTQVAGGRAAGFAHGQKTLARWKRVPVYKWCWVTFGEQIGVISRECRSLTDHGRRIDLLIADVTLPTSSGIQVALLLRSKIPALPVILTSGYPVHDWSDGDLADLGRLGANSVVILSKPFYGNALKDVVRDLMELPLFVEGPECIRRVVGGESDSRPTRGIVDPLP